MALRKGLRVFDPGQSFDGYWSYSHMAVQTEGCMDCLKVLLPDFDHLLLFDYSSGHSKKRINGLDANAMSKGYGGSNQSGMLKYTKRKGSLVHFPGSSQLAMCREWCSKKRMMAPFG